MSSVEKLEAAWKEFETLTAETAEFGAADTEPDGEFQHCIRQHYLRRPYQIPVTPDDWQIFEMAGAKAVARRMTGKLRKVLKAIDNFKPEEHAALRECLDGMLWRVSI